MKTNKFKILISFILLVNFFVPVFANDELVYIDKSNIDTKYHRITCDHIYPDGYTAISVEEAFCQGYRRCTDCSPALSDVEKSEKEKRANEIIESINPSNVPIDTDNKKVYVTETGSKYHIAGCNKLDNEPHALSLDSATSKGYAPCKNCNPYGLADTFYAKKANNSTIIVILMGAILLLIAYIIINEVKYRKRNS